MSALLIDVAEPMIPERHWVRVEHPHARAARSRHSEGGRRGPTTKPAGRPGGVSAPRLRSHSRVAEDSVSSLRLTRRGRAVVISGFLLLMAVSLVVLVTSFLSVSNEPLTATGSVASLLAGA